MRLTLLVLLAEYMGLALMAALGYMYHGVVPQWLIETLRSQINQTAIGPLYIFGHNAIIMAADSIPFIGPVALAISISATGFVLGAVVGYSPLAGQLGPAALLIAYLVTAAMPHGILELSSYAFATAGSIDATRRVLSRRGGALRTWLIHLAIALVLLLAAAYVEWYEIKALSAFLPHF